MAQERPPKKNPEDFCSPFSKNASEKFDFRPNRNISGGNFRKGVQKQTGFDFFLCRVPGKMYFNKKFLGGHLYERKSKYANNSGCQSGACKRKHPSLTCINAIFSAKRHAISGSTAISNVSDTSQPSGYAPIFRESKSMSACRN